MTTRLLESMLTSFQYHAPKDPEKLLYDFYFLVGYVYGIDLHDPVSNFAAQEAVRDCVLNLRWHMIYALKFSLSCELSHLEDTNFFQDTPSVEQMKKVFPPDVVEFTKHYLALMAINTSEKVNLIKAYSPELISKASSRHYPDPLENQMDRGARGRDYPGSYDAVVATQKKMGISDTELARIIRVLFRADKIGWDMGYGGNAWADIAVAFGKLALATEISDAIVWIDHAYDLQHNNGTVFSKLKAYYKKGGLSWIQKALDWKKDVKDIRKFYVRVSGDLRPIVAWVAFNHYGLTLEGTPEEIAAAKQKAEVAKQKALVKTAAAEEAKKQAIERLSAFSTGTPEPVNEWIVGHYYVYTKAKYGHSPSFTSGSDSLADGFPHLFTGKEYPGSGNLLFDTNKDDDSEYLSMFSLKEQKNFLDLGPTLAAVPISSLKMGISGLDMFCWYALSPAARTILKVNPPADALFSSAYVFRGSNFSKTKSLEYLFMSKEGKTFKILKEEVVLLFPYLICLGEAEGAYGKNLTAVTPASTFVKEGELWVDFTKTFTILSEFQIINPKVTQFTVGRWYAYVGDSGGLSGWNGHMIDLMGQRIPRLCTAAGQGMEASFESSKKLYTWMPGKPEPNLFVEVAPPTASNKKGK